MSVRPFDWKVWMERMKWFIVLLVFFIMVTPMLVGDEAPINHEGKTELPHFLKNKNISDELVVMSMAMLPIFELRGAIPWAIHHYHMPWYKAYFLCVIGNFIPIPIILLILKFGLDLLSRISFFKKFFEWLFARTRKKGSLIKKYEAIGLLLFVMIPLPVTGAWTGSVAAYIFGIKFFPALLCILVGICLAGVIVTILSLFGIWGALIASLALLTLFILWLIKFIKAIKVSRSNEKGAF